MDKINDNLSTLTKVKEQSGDSWLKLAREVVENLPQAKGIWEEIKNTVLKAQAEPQSKVNFPMDEAEPTQRTDKHDKAIIIYEAILEIMQKHKENFGDMTGEEILKLLYNFIEEHRDKIKTKKGKDLLFGMKLIKRKAVKFIEGQL